MKTYKLTMVSGEIKIVRVDQFGLKHIIRTQKVRGIMVIGS